MVNAAGTGRPACVIAARPAPLPPRRSLLLAGASSAMYTHCSPADRLRWATPAAPCVSTAIVISLRGKLVIEVVVQPGTEMRDWHAPKSRLVHAVPIPDRDLVVLQRLEVDGDAKRCADLVLA